MAAALKVARECQKGLVDRGVGLAIGLVDAAKRVGKFVIFLLPLVRRDAHDPQLKARIAALHTVKTEAVNAIINVASYVIAGLVAETVYNRCADSSKVVGTTLALATLALPVALIVKYTHPTRVVPAQLTGEGGPNTKVCTRDQLGCEVLEGVFVTGATTLLPRPLSIVYVLSTESSVREKGRWITLIGATYVGGPLVAIGSLTLLKSSNMFDIRWNLQQIGLKEDGSKID